MLNKLATYVVVALLALIVILLISIAIGQLDFSVPCY